MSRVYVTVTVYFRSSPPADVTPEWLIQNVLPAETRPQEVEIIDKSKLPKELTFRVTSVSKTADVEDYEDKVLEDLKDVALEEAKDNDILRKYIIRDVHSETTLEARQPAIQMRERLRGRGKTRRLRKKSLRKKTRAHRIRV